MKQIIILLFVFLIATLRAETVFILSSLDKSTLAEFPNELDPCVDEVLGHPEVISRISTITVVTTAKTPKEAESLLDYVGIPFVKKKETEAKTA